MSDRFGNKYFKNDNEHSGRNRWVDYAQVRSARSAAAFRPSIADRLLPTPCSMTSTDLKVCSSSLRSDMLDIGLYAEGISLLLRSACISPLRMAPVAQPHPSRAAYGGCQHDAQHTGMADAAPGELDGNERSIQELLDDCAKVHCLGAKGRPEAVEARLPGSGSGSAQSAHCGICIPIMHLVILYTTTSVSDRPPNC